MLPFITMTTVDRVFTEDPAACCLDSVTSFEPLRHTSRRGDSSTVPTMYGHMSIESVAGRPWKGIHGHLQHALEQQCVYFADPARGILGMWGNGRSKMSLPSLAAPGSSAV